MLLFRIARRCLLPIVIVFAAMAAPASHGIAVANMDPAVQPGNDFFQYCNGGWIARTAIPPDRAAVEVFGELADRSDRQTSAIIARVAKSNPAPGSEARKIADLYNSVLDLKAIDTRGMAPLHAQLAAIAAVHSRDDLARALGLTLRADVDALNDTNFHTPSLFGLWTAPGFHDAAHYYPYLLQGGLELPDREYYLDTSARMTSLRARYQKHIAAMLGLEGFSDGAARAARILRLEHAIAAVHRSLADNEDIHKADNLWQRADFARKAPGLNWQSYLQAAGLGSVSSFYVWQPEAFAGEAKLVASTPLDTWKDWLAYHLIEDYAVVLPQAVRNESFAFFGKVVSGVPQQRPRWQVGVALVNAELGDAVGKLYAQQYFPASSKAAVTALVRHLIAVYHQRLASITWMNPATNAEAQKKLDTLYVGVGYPETWRSYTGLVIQAGDAYGNIWRSQLFDYHHSLGQLGHAVDKREWHMEPQTVNAVNLPLQNALNFPAAILQPPFFDPQAPDAANYGAIGALIGHEVSHTFDTEGSTFDGQGQLRNWWTPADLRHFDSVTSRLAAQYSAYHPFPDLAVNGRQTLAEDIADVAGLAAAFDALHAADKGHPGPTVAGFSPDQQFFIAFGQNYAEKVRDAALRRQVLTDPHAPGRYRADTVRNLDPWYALFQVKPGQKLYLAPTDRIRIW